MSILNYVILWLKAFKIKWNKSSKFKTVERKILKKQEGQRYFIRFPYSLPFFSLILNQQTTKWKSFFELLDNCS